MKAVLNEFQDSLEKETGKALGERLSKAWEEYVPGHLERVAKWANWWIQDRIKTIRPSWKRRCDTATNPSEKEFACAMHGVLEIYTGPTRQPRVDTAIFE